MRERQSYSDASNIVVVTEGADDYGRGGDRVPMVVAAMVIAWQHYVCILSY